MKLIETYFKTKKRILGRAVNFRVDTIVLPDKNKADREYMEHPGAVCVLPFVDSKRIVLVEQYRYPVKQATLELPAGKLDKGESSLACVRRELLEETGFYAKKVKKIFSFWPTAAFSDEVIHIYTATGLIEKESAPDKDEFIKTHIIPIEKAFELLKKGKIRDSKTVIALLLWFKNKHG
jgi:ADP-ribose pyrophosphatase